MSLMTLRSLVVDHLRDDLSHHNAVVAHLYCNYREHEEQSAEKMIASLLKQLTISNPNIPQAVAELHRKFGQQKRQPLQQDFEQTFLLMCEHYKRIFIIIDALDECDATHKKGLLKFLNLIQRKSSVRIMVTSRLFPDNVLRHLDTACSINISAHETDLRKYILQEIDNSDNVDVIDDDFRHEITDKVCAGAQEMYVRSSQDCARLSVYLYTAFDKLFLSSV